MMAIDSYKIALRTLSGLLSALLLFAIISILPRNSHAQTATSSDSTTNAQQQQTVVSALPEVTTTRVVMNAATATGHPQTITLPGASSQPLVHSPFDTHAALPQTLNRGAEPVRTVHAFTTLQQTAYRAGEPVRAVNAFEVQPAPVYHSGGDGDARERSVLDVETTAPAPSSPAGEYTGSLRIMLTSDSPATSIYFTLDGETPTTDSFLYVHPFTLHASATLKAIAIDNGKTPSRITTAEYKITQPTLSFELGSNGNDSVEIFLTLNAPGAASVAGKWTVTDGTLTLCTADMTTETTLHCPAKLNRGNHDLKATYSGANNGWQLTTGSTVRIN
jgi:hypothetical protein